MYDITLQTFFHALGQKREWGKYEDKNLAYLHKVWLRRQRRQEQIVNCYHLHIIELSNQFPSNVTSPKGHFVIEIVYTSRL